MADIAEIQVILPKLDATQSVESATFEAVTLGTENKVIKAFENKNNSLHIVVDATEEGTITFKAGDNYPNAMLGDLVLPVGEGINDYIIEDISRFENRDLSLDIESTATGKIYAVAKRAGLKPVEE